MQTVGLSDQEIKTADQDIVWPCKGPCIQQAEELHVYWPENMVYGAKALRDERNNSQIHFTVGDVGTFLSTWQFVELQTRSHMMFLKVRKFKRCRSHQSLLNVRNKGKSGWLLYLWWRPVATEHFCVLTAGVATCMSTSEAVWNYTHMHMSVKSVKSHGDLWMVQGQCRALILCFCYSRW